MMNVTIKVKNLSEVEKFKAVLEKIDYWPARIVGNVFVFHFHMTHDVDIDPKNDTLDIRQHKATPLMSCLRFIAAAKKFKHAFKRFEISMA
jgi:hypothetical protein